VTPSDQAAAQAALNDGRPVYGRLDQIRGPEDAAADIMELWAAAESAMRALLGGSALAGQDLVRELRQRGILNLEQANTLASFWDARSRADDVSYKPTLTDVGFARAGYNELGRIASQASALPAQSGEQPESPYAPGGARAAARTVVPPPDAVAPDSTHEVHDLHRERRFSMTAIVAVGVVALLLVAGIAAYFTFGRSHFDSDMASAINLMQTGRTEAALGAFGAITHEYPDKAAPHVFLSRLARQNNPPDMNTARQELVTAIRLQPNYEPAQREMGIYLLAARDPSLARNFLIRAVQLAPDDSAAQGYLGCALMGMNRPDDAQKFLSRAGTGTWSSCAATQPAATSTVTPAVTPAKP
jgi:Flp pilus assembly protein TadD